MGIGSRIIVCKNIAVQRKFAEEWSHAAGYTRHRTDGRKHHRLGMRMLVERRIDALPIAYLVIFLQNRIPHPILQFIIHNTIEFFTLLSPFFTQKVEAVGILVGKFPELLFRNLSWLHANSIINNRLRIVQSPSCIKPYIYPQQIFNYPSENHLFLRIVAALGSKKDKPTGEFLP